MFTLIRGSNLRNATLFFGSITLSLLACSACQRNGESTSERPDVLKATSSANSAQAGSSSTHPSKGTPDRTVMGYLCPAGPECESDVLGASSDEEARWLIQNGYPSAEELKRFSAMSDVQLKKEADAGSLSAMVNYGERLVSQGEPDAGLVYIFDATQRGSIYGYYAMSTVYKTPGLGSIVESGAYLRVAYILGDTKASEELQRRFPGLQQMEQAAIDRRAASLYRTFAQSRQPSPRP